MDINKSSIYGNADLLDLSSGASYSTRKSLRRSNDEIKLYVDPFTCSQHYF